MLAVLLSAFFSLILSWIIYQHEILTVNAADFCQVLPRLARKGWRVVGWAECELARERVARVVMVRARLSPVWG